MLKELLQTIIAAISLAFIILIGVISQSDHKRCNCSCELGGYVLKTAVPLYFKPVKVCNA